MKFFHEDYQISYHIFEIYREIGKFKETQYFKLIELY